MALAQWFVVFLVGLAACSPLSDPFQPHILVEWTTASEINTAGFNLYRSEHADGPYAKVNPQLLSASLDPVLGGRYRYVDTGVTPGKTYYYQLEDVEFSGATARHGPITIRASSAWETQSNIVALFAVGAIVFLCASLVLWRCLQQRGADTGNPSFG